MMKMDDTLLDYLNYQMDILTYYTPYDTTIDKVPLLNKELSEKMATTKNSRPKGSTEGRKQDHSQESICRRAGRKGQEKKRKGKGYKSSESGEKGPSEILLVQRWKTNQQNGNLSPRRAKAQTGLDPYI